MLTDEANQLKKQKREEQLKRWREREQQYQMEQSQSSLNTNNDSSLQKSLSNRQRSPRVRFPQACAFLASCSSNDIDEVKYYLKLGVNINTTNIDGLTALHQACIDDNFDMVKFLIDNNADLNVQDNEGWTPVHAAISDGNLEITKYLVSKGAKLNICNNDGDLPIDLCDINNKTSTSDFNKYDEIRKYLEDEMKKQNIDIEYEKKREELVMYEDAKEKNFHNKIHPKTGATPLHVSAAKGYTRVLRLLIEGGANVNAIDKDGWTPLHAAAYWDEEESCRILAENGADFEIKTFAGQNVFDICDEDMIEKLKQLQAKVANTRSSIDLVPIKQPASINVQKQQQICKISNDDIKVTTQSLTTITNKKREHLSQNINELIDGDKNIKSNIALTSNNNNINMNTETSSTQSNIGLDINTNLKIQQVTNALSNRKDESINERLSSSSNIAISPVSLTNSQRLSSDKRWGTNTNTNDVPYKRRLTATTSLPTNHQSINDTSITNTTINNNNNNNNNNNIQLTESEFNLDNGNSTNNNSNNDIRRYSLAPIASKDEQAELIRKQKAKLERHYRRSTQAVSYEDIKSAEATIKATLNNNNDLNQQVVDLSPKTMPSPQQLVPPLPNQSPPNLSTFSSSNYTLTTPVSSTSNNKINVTTNSDNQTTASPVALSNNIESISEKDTIIAKDIETDKLLNAIEKSKGFSDAYSTTRRLRNRSQGLNQLSLFDRLNSINDTSASLITNTANNNNSTAKKINKLIWNEDKLEVEYRDKDETLLDQQQQYQSTIPSINTTANNIATVDNNSIVKRQYSVPDARQIQSQLNIISSGSSNSGGHTSRLKLATNDNNNSSLINNRVNVKRSVSQVPTSTSDRYFSTSASSSSRLTSPNVSNQSNNDTNVDDNRIIMELIKKENEELKSQIKKLQKELDDLKRASINSNNNSNNEPIVTVYTDKREKRASERRISELEEEVKKMESIKQDNLRLKEENAALIRVISKLSK